MPKSILIIGGTRNLGHQLALEALRAGHRVTVFNRGKTTDELPPEVERLQGDRTEPAQLEAALNGRTFDAVVDNALYKEDEAHTVARILQGKTNHYLFLSSGQVYLVREGLKRPFAERDYGGPVMPAPKPESYDYTEWLYGVDKRRVEDALIRAWEKNGFPFTCLRIPMVNSERDHFRRLYGYILRLRDGGPLLAPDQPNLPLRHIYGMDVVRALLMLIESGRGKGKAYNISQEETVSHEAFVHLLAELMGVQADLRVFKRADLEANGFLPDCAPFTDRWMSELDNTRSKDELGMSYTPLREYLGKLVAHYSDHPPRKPASYQRRQAEIQFAG
jgi:nucleoside-diphosphate-sugar epimerase